MDIEEKLRDALSVLKEVADDTAARYGNLLKLADRGDIPATGNGLVEAYDSLSDGANKLRERIRQAAMGRSLSRH